MKILAMIFLIAVSIVSCKEAQNENDNAFGKAEKEELLTPEQENGQKGYGEPINLDNVLTKSEVAQRYAALKEGDTTVLKFKAPINAVCAEKGCWMRLDITDEQQVFVKFKDYGFFVPTDTNGGQAIVQGKAYLEEVSVKELRHMAKDGGESEEEIATITEPQRELRFMADGVLLTSE
ncbi:DUF4920 domain-containing protein [Dokdonia sp. Hel_I_53]|uniref:DUF4920 domain-containing protein n=1 Tax=Dokdonia sp. Hel_I_53 TaxID=1566287 RepID=UPI00119B9353|nr:DUF4920 domain-containing protein [Dokdonia sp. Hel_I_53]TVZ53015.1 uncharacterized protein DUF4920 [Dokdonia sp. Hel_I_53]